MALSFWLIIIIIIIIIISILTGPLALHTKQTQLPTRQAAIAHLIPLYAILAECSFKQIFNIADAEFGGGLRDSQDEPPPPPPLNGLSLTIVGVD